MVILIHQWIERRRRICDVSAKRLKLQQGILISRPRTARRGGVAARESAEKDSRSSAYGGGCFSGGSFGSSGANISLKVRNGRSGMSTILGRM